MTTSIYQLTSFTGTVASWPRPRFLHDHTDSFEMFDREIDARVRSGDYFVTLATILDQLNQNIDDYQVRSSLEELVSELIYLQDTYEITKRDDVV